MNIRKYFIMALAAASLCVSCADKATVEDFVTYAEETDFVKTPKFEQTMEFFQRLEKYSPMVNIASFGTSPLGRDLSLVVVDKDGLADPEDIR